MSLLKRKGCIPIAFNFFDEHVEQLSEALKGFVPMHIESDFSRRVMNLFGVHPDFDIIDDGCVAPIYDIVVTQEEDSDEVTITWSKAA